jgi:hypothetical protein
VSETNPDDLENRRIPKEEWKGYVTRVTNDMKEYTKQFVTPISKVIDHNTGEAWGTGNYLELHKQRYLLTNEHVAEALKSNPLGHQFLNTDSVFRATQPFDYFKWPLDVAVSPIEEKVWATEPHGSVPIPESKFALAHAPVDAEVLFLKGFKAAMVPFLFDTLITNATSYGCQEIPIPPDDHRLNPRFHFALDYRPDSTTSLDGRDLPTPDGFSGSLVWNTRFVEMSINRQPWDANCAQVTGLVWGWPSSRACLVATRIEYIRSFLLRAVTA